MFFSGYFRFLVIAFMVVGTLLAAMLISNVELVSPSAGANAWFGNSIANAGDVNGDGIDDIMVGAPYEPSGGFGNIGGVHVYSGSDGSPLFDYVSPTIGFGGQFGFDLSPAGDLDGDGVPDAVIAANNQPGAFPDLPGRVYAFSSNTKDTLYTISSPEDAEGEDFGHSVSAIADINGDGQNDILIGAPKQNAAGIEEAGRAYIFSGSSGGFIDSLISPNPEVVGQFGIAVSFAGDVNNDGTPDILVGAFNESLGGGIDDEGRVYVFSGTDRSLLHTLESPFPWSSGSFGIALAGIDDIDGDNHDDIIVGADNELCVSFLNCGNVYVFSGATGDTLRSLASPFAGNGIFFGASVSTVDDMDSDGIQDILVGEINGNGATLNDIGRVTVFSGATGDTLATVISPEPKAVGKFGSAVAGLGDTNGDGQLDIAVGARWENGSGVNRAGKAFLFRDVVVTGLGGGRELAPVEFSLKQNYPNPFNPATTIAFELVESGSVQLDIYNALGQHVRSLVNEDKTAGSYELRWNGKDDNEESVGSGVYLYRLIVNGQTESRKMLFLQ